LNARARRSERRRDFKFERVEVMLIQADMLALLAALRARVMG